MSHEKSDLERITSEIKSMEEKINGMLMDLGRDHVAILASRRVVPTKPKLRKKEKALWKEIANACHPDKTNDPRAHEIFLQATKAKESGDLAELYECYIRFKGESAIPVEIEEDSFAALLHKYRQLKSSFFWSLYDVYVSDRNLASRIYGEYLIDVI